MSLLLLQSFPFFPSACPPTYSISGRRALVPKKGSDHMAALRALFVVVLAGALPLLQAAAPGPAAKSDAEWVKVGARIPGNPESQHERFGEFVSLSADGLTMLNGGGYPDKTGYIEVFKWTGASVTSAGAWVQVGDGLPGVHGIISADGKTIAIGKVGDNNKGRVQAWTFDGQVWQRKGSEIDGEQGGDESGRRVGELSLSADGSVLAIGANVARKEATVATKGSNAGKVRVFEYQKYADNWVQRGETLHGTQSIRYYGRSVSLSSDGNILAVGATGFAGHFLDKQHVDYGGPSAGYVRVFKWTRMEKKGEVFYRWAQMGDDITGEAEEDRFGSSLSLSADGLSLSIGANLHDTADMRNVGHVRVFTWQGKTWTQKGQEIVGESLGDMIGDAGAVHLDASGNVLAIGSRTNDANGEQSGHVRIFRYESNKWVQAGPTIQGESEADEAGASVAVVVVQGCLMVAVGEPGHQRDDSETHGHVRAWVLCPDDADADGSGKDAASPKVKVHGDPVFKYGDKAKQFWMASGRPATLLEWTHNGTTLKLAGETFDTADGKHQARPYLKLYPHPPSVLSHSCSEVCHVSAPPPPNRFAVVQASDHPEGRHVGSGRDRQADHLRQPRSEARWPDAH